LSNIIPSENAEKRKCIECGKNLHFLEGHSHPTLGAEYLVCRECYFKVELSVDRWRRFILWNSFNPESPDPTYIENLPIPQANTETIEKKSKHQKHFRFIL